jgi:ubiquinone/menaquinone biosynthesis C-methylase UbiE
MLDVLNDRIKADGVPNVEPILGTVTDPNLPSSSVDVAIIVASYHEFSHPREMMTHIVEALKPGGRFILVEYRGEDATLSISPLRRMTEAQARKEMEAVGLTFFETRDILPQQHFMVFMRPVA